MNGQERFKKVMEILDKNNLCNNTINHRIFEKHCKNEDLENENIITEVVQIIRDCEERRESEDKNKYPEYIMEFLRQRKGLNEYDISEDKDINTLTANEALDEVCNWNGLIHYANTIKGWVKDIYKIDLDKIE